MNYQQLWAPWRLAYVTGKQEQKTLPLEMLLPGADPGCFLCQGAVAKGVENRQRMVVHHGRTCLTVLNRYPYNNGHLLVAPARHRDRLDLLDAEEQLDLMQTIGRMTGLLERTLRAEGFNVGLNLGQVAGAGLPGHVHWHIVPRWNGDTNFMPVSAGVRVIPQSLEMLWELLTAALDQEDGPRCGGGDSGTTRAPGAESG